MFRSTATSACILYAAISPALFLGSTAGAVAAEPPARTTFAATQSELIPETNKAEILKRVAGSSAYTIVVPKSVAKSQLQARLVIPAGLNCPALQIKVATSNGTKTRKKKSRVRIAGASTKAAFSDVQVCQSNLPKAAIWARFGSAIVPASLPKKVRKVAIIGDTGCWMKGSTIQNCSSSQDWPLARNARSIAKARPDAVLFLGDYLYREAPCPPDQQLACGGSPPPVGGMPFKDQQYSWFADVMIPMAPMLAQTPILPVRGNHEACNRGGNGFFLFFDASKLGAASCAPNANNEVLSNNVPTYAIDLPLGPGRTLRTIAVDTAYGSDEEVTDGVSTQRPEYQKARQLASKKKGRESWLLTHRPIYGLTSTEFLEKPTDSPWGSADQAASASGLLGNFKAIFSSHIHLTQQVTIPGYPNQFIVGNGGTLLDPTTGYGIPSNPPLTNGLGQPLSPDYPPYPNATSQWTDVRFGHVIAKPLKKAPRWELKFKSPSGKTFRTCKMVKQAASC